MQHQNQLHTVMAVRKFNRFYTKYFGLLRKRLLGSEYSLTEARILYDLAQTGSLTSKEIGEELELDAGYLSRIIKRFETLGIITKERSNDDGRAINLSLTQQGRAQAAIMAERSNEDIADKLSSLNSTDLDKVVTALEHVENTLSEPTTMRPTPIIRSHRAGDMGWILSEHGKYYAEHHGFNESFEALVAKITSDFINNYNPKTEHCWIAEVNGKNVGSVMLVRDSETTARLRLLYVDPTTQGLGLGKHLVNECIVFAKNAGYTHIELWTNAVLTAARHVYIKAGFELTAEDTHDDFGDPQVGQTWRLKL